MITRVAPSVCFPLMVILFFSQSNSFSNENLVLTLGPERGTIKFLYGAPEWRNMISWDDDTDAFSSPHPWISSDRSNVPRMVLDNIKKFISAHAPELEDAQIVIAKLCWDSVAIHNDFLIDWTPDMDGCIIASGGSNHGKSSSIPPPLATSLSQVYYIH
jgi:hypothetical protein